MGIRPVVAVAVVVVVVILGVGKCATVSIGIGVLRLVKVVLQRFVSRFRLDLLLAIWGGRGGRGGGRGGGHCGHDVARVALDDVAAGLVEHEIVSTASRSIAPSCHAGLALACGLEAGVLTARVC